MTTTWSTLYKKAWHFIQIVSSEDLFSVALILMSMSTYNSEMTSQAHQKIWLIVLGFNNTSTLVGHFVSSPREKE